MSSVRECHKDLIQNVQIFHYFVLFYIETRRSLIRDYKCDHATLWRLLRWNRKDNFFPRIICECVDCDYYFDYYTSVDNFEDCKSKCKWSCRSEFAIRISLLFWLSTTVRCGHFSYNFNESSPFYGHCYLSYDCSDPQPAPGDWVSAPKVRKYLSENIGNGKYFL